MAMERGPLTAAHPFPILALLVLAALVVLPAAEPLAAFPFDGSVDGRGADGRELAGKAVVRAPFMAGVQGQAVVVRRWAYDQKASLGWSDLAVPRCFTLTVHLRTLWDGPATPHDLIDVIDGQGGIALAADAAGALTLRLVGQEPVLRLEPAPGALAAGFVPVVVAVDLERGRWSLAAGDRRSEGAFPAGAGERLLRGPVALRLGGRSASNFDGDAADAAFDDLRIHAGWLDASAAAQAMAAGASGAAASAGDDAPAWLARFTQEQPDAQEQSWWSLTGAEEQRGATRRLVCLNGLWRFAPALGDARAATPRLYSRLSGTWLKRSDQQFTVIDGTGAEVGTVAGQDIQGCLRGWYRRVVELDDDLAGRQLALTVRHVGAARVRFFANGAEIGTWRLAGRYDQGLMQDLRLPLPAPAGRRLDLAIEATFEDKSGMGRIVLMDLALEGLRGGVRATVPRIHTAVARGELALEGRVECAPGTALAPGTTVEAVVERAGARVLALPPRPVAADGGWRLAGDGSALAVWSTEEPVLHTARVVVRDAAGAVLDETLPEPFGWRELAMGAHRFLLNGVPLRLAYCSSANPGVVGYRWAGLTAQPDFARQAVAALRQTGFNAIFVEMIYHKDDDEWFGRRSPVWQQAVVRACDKLGMLVVFKLPEFLPGTDEAAYRAAVASQVRTWGNHPSIGFWLNDFNKCMYVMQQHPAMVNDLAYAPASRAANRASIVRGDRIIAELDPARIVYHNAGGNLTRLYTVMQYMSFGLPLQEREDWPAQWEKKNLYMATEFGFPFGAQFFDFGNPRYFERARLLLVEHAARFGGEAVYRDTSADYGAMLSAGGQFDRELMGVDGALWPEYGLVKKAFASANLRAWRGYDVSGYGIFGEEDALWRHPNLDPARKAFYQWKPGVPAAGCKRFGVHPDAIAHEPRLPDLARPTDYQPVLRRALAPVVAYLVDGGARWNAKDHAYWVGERLEKAVLVLNDSLRPRQLRLALRLLDGDGRELWSRRDELTLAAGERATVPVALPLPAVERRTALRLEAALSGAEVEPWREELALQVFPPQPPLPPRSGLALYDPKGLTAAAFARLGVAARAVTRIEDLGDATTLVVGRQALGGAPDPLLAAVERAGLIERGLELVVFEQQDACLGDLIFQPQRQRQAFVTDAAHPALAGLADEDFRDWRGGTDLCVDNDRPERDWDGEVWIFPTFRFTCGNLGVVASQVLRKPVYGSFRPILSCGMDLGSSPLAEIRRGRGRVLLCQLDVTARVGRDPVATRVVANLLAGDGRTVAPAAPAALRLGVWDPAARLGPLAAFARGARALARLDDLDGVDAAVVCGADQAALGAAAASFAAFTARGGTLLVVGRPPAGRLAWAPVAVEVAAITGVGSLLAHQPGLPGWLSNADLFLRRTVPAAAFQAAGAAFLDDRRTVASIPAGRGRLLLVGYDLQDVQPIPIELGKDSYRTTRVPTWFDTVEPDGLLDGTRYTSFIEVLASYKPVRLVHALLDQLGAFDAQPLFTAATRQAGRIDGRRVGVTVRDWRFRIDPEEVGEARGWQGGDGDGWKPIRLGESWESQGWTQPNLRYANGPDGKPDTQQYNGVAWYVASVELPEALRSAGEVRLEFAGADDFDTAYVNGEKVGSTGRETAKWWEAPRSYVVPAALLAAGGRATIAIRVTDVYMGGMVKGPVRLVLVPPAAAAGPTPYPAGFPVLDPDAFHNW